MDSTWKHGGIVWVLGIACLLAVVSNAQAKRDIVSYAFVNDDATLRIRNKKVRLFGIYTPPTQRACQRAIRPPRCGSRAALALDFRIQGFVRCTPIERLKDGSVLANCRNGDINLSEYLLGQGWAVALPDAPFAYHAIERVARHRNLGVWGRSIDTYTRRH